jgi:hypothetical protein
LTIHVLLVICLILETPALLLAESDSEDSSAVSLEPLPEYQCFKGGPLPECSRFWVTEFSYLSRLGKSGESKWYLTGELGLMFNLNEGGALGGVLYLGGSDDFSRGGFGPRYRIWLRNAEGKLLAPRLDFTAVPLFWMSGSGQSAPGLMASASINISDWIAFTFQAELIKFTTGKFVGGNLVTQSEADLSLYLGVKGASYLGPIALVTFFVVVLITMAAEGQEGYW